MAESRSCLVDASYHDHLCSFGSYAVGNFSVVGSVTLRWRTGNESGTYLITSSTVINSGPAVFDQLNTGVHVEWWFSSANSQNPSYFVLREPLR